MQSRDAAAYRAVPAERVMILTQANTSNDQMDGWMEHTVHGPPMQSRDAAAYRAVPAERVMILAQANTSNVGWMDGTHGARAANAVP